MSWTCKELLGLISVLEAGFQAEQGRMASIGRRIDRLRKAISDLSPERTSGSGVVLDPAVRVGADVRWSIWAENRRRALNAELAEQMRQKEAKREELARAFGRLQAARSMLDGQVASDKRRERRG